MKRILRKVAKLKKATYKETPAKKDRSVIGILAVTLLILFTNADAKPLPMSAVKPGNGEVTVSIDLELKVETLPHPMTDILFVLDNSGSMDKYQMQLSKFASHFLDRLKGVDYQIGAITTDSGILAGQKPFLNSGALISELENLWKVGHSGDANEVPLASLQEAVANAKTKNSGFFRDEADLIVVLFTDTEDQSAYTPMDVLESLRQLSPQGKNVTVHGLLADGNVCVGEWFQPYKLTELVSKSGGSVFDICAADYTPALDLITAPIPQSGPITSTTTKITSISLYPDCDASTLQVSFGNRILVQGDSMSGYIWNPTTFEIELGNQIDWSTAAVSTPLIIKYKRLK
jgi:hypothetical protein